MRKYILIASLIFVFTGCDYIASDTSKAMTEKEQLSEMRRQNALLEEQNTLLLRIALALEKNAGLVYPQRKD